MSFGVDASADLAGLCPVFDAAEVDGVAGGVGGDSGALGGAYPCAGWFEVLWVEWELAGVLEPVGDGGVLVVE